MAVEKGEKNNSQLDACRRAIAAAGGPKRLAQDLTSALNYEVSRERVAKWRFVGIPLPFIVAVSVLSGIGTSEMLPRTGETNAREVKRRRKAE